MNYLSLPFGAMDDPPLEEGEYLFFFGTAKEPYFDLDVLHFYEDDEGWYLENCHNTTPTLWVCLPSETLNKLTLRSQE